MDRGTYSALSIVALSTRIIVENGGTLRLKLLKSLFKSLNIPDKGDYIACVRGYVFRGRYNSTPDKAAGLRRVGGEGFQARSYSVRIGCSEDVRRLIDAYARLLERALGEIWSRIVWCERVIRVRRPVQIPVSDKKRILPMIPMDNGLYKYLRGLLLRDWEYNRQYVYAAVKDAYRILKIWKRRCNEE